MESVKSFSKKRDKHWNKHYNVLQKFCILYLWSSYILRFGILYSVKIFVFCLLCICLFSRMCTAFEYDNFDHALTLFHNSTISPLWSGLSKKIIGSSHRSDLYWLSILHHYRVFSISIAIRIIRIFLSFDRQWLGYVSFDWT